MSRELKFRVWNGAEMVYDVTIGKFGVFYVNPSNNGLDQKDSASLTPFTTKYDDKTHVMQATGLTDQYGNEIYSFDIVRYGTPYHGEIKTVHIGFVHYNEHCAAFQIAYRNITNSFVSDFIHRFTVIEVIGNRYQNPELLKQ